MGILGILTIVFIVLKLINVITWSWWLVLLPGIIEIIDGEITKDEEVKFDDYNWDCICPNIGG